MTGSRDGFVRVGTLDELRARGRMVVKGRRCPLLVVHHDGQVRAIDNRCPHLGFPLHKGTIEDGIVTCHWHHARFDLASGGTFDLWADDVPTAEVRIDGGEVFVAAECRLADPADHWRRRLHDGMAHDLGLVIAKAVLGARAAGVADRSLVTDAALFGATMRDGFGVGTTILTALANLLPELPEEEGFLALFQGIRRVAADCAGEPPRRARAPLAGSEAPAPVLARWLRQWIAVRHRNGAERTLLTALAEGVPLPEVAAMLLAAVTDRPYADGGHALDFANKAFECVDVIGAEHAPAILPTVIGQMAAARGADEETAWRHPIDLIALLDRAHQALPDALAEGRAAPGGYAGHAALAETLLGDDPQAIVDALLQALRAGASGVDLGKALAYGAVLRIARFGTANEFGDWDTALHVFTHANAVHQLLKRVAGPVPDRGPGGTAGEPVPDDRAGADGLRAVFQGAMALYLARYLNQPPARLPGERGETVDDLPSDPGALRRELLAAFDRQQQVGGSARLVARHLDLGHPPAPLIETLAHALLREDAGFHTFQMCEAGIRQFHEWQPASGGTSPEGRAILIATTRYLAAHSPTERARFQTATIARRLHRGGRVHEDAEI